MRFFEKNCKPVQKLLYQVHTISIIETRTRFNGHH